MEEVGTMTNLKKFKNKEELLEELSSDIVELLQDEIEEKGKASLLVSGGSTPKPLFQKLSNIDIPWEKVIISLVDDRWLEPTHKDSNELLVKENLMQNFASKAKFVGMFIEGKTAYESDEDCSLTYEDNVFPFDVIILGMGGDSHTASLFPENEKLKEAYDLKNENLCISIKPDTAPYDRMSLTLGAILSAKNIILHIEGEEKLKVYEEALNSKDIFKTPISAVLNNERLIEVYHA
ncbi:6-phosphogluconolactonase [Arcobacter arenosus]|jgi:6-phosphogluconolactonase|uniref:6-phosphogluconolactonase n=2 Tax=Arcobacter arenosus TaxID=2576037 RepID=A0A5R8XZD5_9BACT|nr:6-phosphogluconolactonase [Arcobacter arenosus]